MINFISAGDELKGYLAQTIYNDCRGDNIDVRPLGLTYLTNRESLEFIKWPYEIKQIYEVINLVINNEPYSVYVGSGQGQTLLSCNGKNLTANFYTYKWDGQRIDPFIYNFEQTVNQVINQIANMNGSDKSLLIQSIGDNNINENKQYNLFSDNKFYLTLAFSIGVSLISITLFELGFSFYRKKKKTKK